jgi:hypothetical protein
MNEKAEFAVEILREYDRQMGVGVRNTSDLSPLEQWLIIELLRVKKLSTPDVVVPKGTLPKCQHDWIKSVTYKNAKCCRKCGQIL